MFRRLLAAWETQHTKPVRPARRLRLESLEAREVPTVTLATIPDQQIANNAPTYLPVTVSNTPNGTVSYDVTSSDAAVTPTIVQGGRSVRFTVSGKNSDGSDFSGDLTIRLFEDAAPLTTARLIQLVNQGFYTNKLFHRVEKSFGGVDESIIQGGSLNGDGTGGSGLGELLDEYNAEFRFNSPGIVASANRGDDTTDNQFFIDRPTTPLANRPQFLNFNYTVFGILTEGADVYERIRNTPLTGSPATRPVSNVTITRAEVFADTENAVLKLVAQSGYTGTAKVTVTPRDADGASTPVAASLTGATANPAQGNPAFLGAIPPTLTTAAGDPVTFSVPFTDADNSPVVVEVRDSTFGSAPANVTVSVNQSAGTVTLTPAAGFTGTINLKVGVRDDVDRTGTGNLLRSENFDTQALTLTVTPASAVPQATVSLSANPASVTAGGSVTLTAGVTATGVSDPDGSVEFRNGGTLLATVAVSGGSASTTQTFATAGTQTLTATFVPANSQVVRGNTSSPVTVTVTAVPASATTTTLGVNPSAPTAGQPSTLSATVAGGSRAFTGTVRFLADGVLLGASTLSAATGTGTANISTTFPTAGSRSLTAEFTPADAAVVSGSTSPAVTAVVAEASVVQPPISSANGVTARGSSAGNPPRVTVFNADGTQRVSFLAFEESFTGGLRTAVADVTGDGAPDVVVVPGYGGAPVIKVFDATTGELVASKMVFEDSFRGGLTLATGDTNGLGYARVLVGAGETGAPRVTLFDFKTNATVLNYYAYDSNLRGGVSVSIGSLPGGSGVDIVTGVGAGGGPQVNVYDGSTGTLLGSTQTGDTADRRGVGVRVGTSPSSSTSNTIFVNRKFGTAGTTEDALTDLSFIKFDAASTTAQQEQIQQILNSGGASS